MVWLPGSTEPHLADRIHELQSAARRSGNREAVLASFKEYENATYPHTGCQMMGLGQNPLGFAYFDPPTHIDD